MWILKKIGSESCHYLHPNKTTFLIGRSGVDFVLPDDASISRTHAKFTQTDGKLELEDVGSKYGTYLNDGLTTNSAIMKNKKIVLRENDTIRFGLMHNSWNLVCAKYAILASALKRDEVVELAQTVQTLGGKILQNWTTECTHLTMNTVTVTIKLLYALVEELPIVTTSYWKDLLKAINANTPVPSTARYPPRVNELGLDISLKPERKTIFKGMTFVFMNRKHYDMYGAIVVKAGGMCKDLNTGVQKTFLIKPNVVVIQYVPSTQSQSSQVINSIVEYLENHSKRIIPEYEIGLALVQCSTEQFCNPNNKELRSLLPSEEQTEQRRTVGSTVIVANTDQSLCVKENSGTDLVVPETDQSVSEVASNKSQEIQKSEESQVLPGPSKRRRIEDQFLDSDSSDSDKDDVSLLSLTKKANTGSNLSIATTTPKSKQTTINEGPSPSKTITTRSSKPLPITKTTRATRSTTEDMQNLEESQNITGPSKRKRGGNIILDSESNDEDDLELFHFTKKPNIKNPKSPKPTSPVEGPSTITKTARSISPAKPINTRSAKPLPIIKTTRATRSIAENMKNLEDPEEIAGPSKSHRAGNKILDSDSDDDVELIQLTKKPNSLNQKSAKSPVPARNMSPAKTSARNNPRALLITKTTRTTRSIAGFLEKSQNRAVHSGKDTNEDNIQQNTDAEKEIEATRKRPIIAVIGDDDDDDDDNLFDFIGDDRSKKVCINTTNPYANNSDNEELFGFNASKQPAHVDVDEDDLIETQPFVDKQPNKNKTSYVQMPKPKVLPQTINISSWLTCGGIKTESKQEAGDNNDGSVKNEDDVKPDEAVLARQKWLESLKGFEVRFRAFNISTHSNDKHGTNKNNDSTDTTHKNFKAFVKKRNPHPSSNIIKLCPIALPGRA